MGAQAIAEQQVVTFPGAARAADVHVHVPGLRGGRPQKAVTALAQVHDQASGLSAVQVGPFIIDIGTLTWMSMTGLAARPGTDVAPARMDR